MTTPLPKSLAHEPLVDAIFEMRMGGSPHLADLLPGFLYGQLGPKPTTQRLPAAEIPQPIREQDPNLIFAPVLRLDWDRFTVSFGERTMVVGCKLPYPKWPAFKAIILDIVRKVAQVGILGPVERYSVKYVNLIQAPTIADQIAMINMSVRVGNVEAQSNHLSVQVHSKEDDILHIMSVVTGAQAILQDRKTVFGVVVDIDSIREEGFPDLGAFAANLEPRIEGLRLQNKVKFFSCLTEEAINGMGPEYD